MVIDDLLPKQLFDQMPTMWIKPVHMDEYKKPDICYECPVYRESSRRGILTTSGHSSNHVMDILLPADQKESFWIKRGVAMLLALDD